MADLDLNLLVALDALLSMRSVTGAAKVLRLSPSAMSRTLSRLREVLGDPVLVPAGRVMVATPHAEAIAAQVRSLNEAAHAVLRPAPGIDVRALKRTFTIRANEAFAVAHAARLINRVAADAPEVSLHFTPKPGKDIRALRDGAADLDIGVISGDGAELRAQTLYRDIFVGVARRGHPLLEREMTPERYAAVGHVSDGRHVAATRHGRFTGPVDDALAELGLAREVKVVVPSFQAVLTVAAETDLIGLVPSLFGEAGRGVVTFPLPVSMPEIVVSQSWHPRLDADPGHRWLRGVVFETYRGG
jgi:DNA-binding transcriptional LysR family regulator